MGRLSILVAEDHEINRFLISKIVESWGCAITLAENGLEVIQKLKEKDFDLILMDIQMPVMDGVDATRRIRALPDKKKSTIPIIAVTANIQPGAKEEYHNAGMNTCISKPINEKELLNILYMIVKGDNDQTEGKPSAASAATDEDNTLYDLTLIRSLSGGDEEFVLKMVRMFLDTMPSSLQTLGDAIGNQDWKTAGNTAHKMKSSIDAMGMAGIKEDIRAIENNSRQMTGLESIPSKFEKISRAMNEVMERLKKDFSLP